jgi:hypothetical protein
MTTTARPLAALLLLTLAAAPGRADDEFKPVGNGKDLSGWTTPDDATLFSIEGGEIVGRTKEGQLKKNEFLVLPGTYGDFELRGKVKILGGNSGIQVRSKRSPNGAVAGPQVDIADEYWGVLYDEGGSRGIIERFDPEKIKSIARKGEWNEIVVTMKGKHLKAVLNGTTIIDREDPLFPGEGVIGLQVHAGPPMEVRFKDLEIRELD